MLFNFVTEVLVLFALFLEFEVERVYSLLSLMRVISLETGDLLTILEYLCFEINNFPLEAHCLSFVGF